MRKFLLATALVLPMAAQATDVRTTVIASPTQTSVNHNTALAAAMAAATARASARATGGNAQSNNSVGVSFNDRLQAPALGGLMAAATGPCVGRTITGQVSFLGGGFGGGASEIERECQVRAAAQLMAGMGEKDVAMLLLLSLPSVREAIEEPKAVVSAQREIAVTQSSAPYAHGFMLNNYNN